MKPILFSTPMVQAVIAGNKTQTRRIIKPQPEEGSKFIGPETFNQCMNDKYGDLYPGPEVVGIYSDDGEWGIKFPYGKIGDILWVRETWQHHGRPDIHEVKYIYKADKSKTVAEIIKWKPSIFMPKEACRLFLEVTDIRVERLQNISERDAISEGIEVTGKNEYRYYNNKRPDQLSINKPIESYRSLWELINGPGSWDLNPWVWVISFKRIEKP
jgi:hypothetical protein